MKNDFVDYFFAAMLSSVSFLIIVISFAIICACLTSCTISFQNISTHGTATDLVDENQSAEPNFRADLTIPMKAI